MTSDNAKAPPRRISIGDLTFQPRFAYGDQAEVTVVTGDGDGTVLGTGYARFVDAAIPWTVRYDEVILVLEGTFSVETPEGTLTAGPHDCIWLPDGTDVVYRAESALVFYAIHPANWAEDAS